MRPAVVHPRLWFVVWVLWCLMCWTAPAQASWEAYHRAGEAAYNHGDYAAAERMWLAAVREARYFGPQDPRLDISLNALAFLRETRHQHASAPRRSEPTTRHSVTAPQGRIAHRGRQRRQPRTALQRARPDRPHQIMRSRRSGGRSAQSSAVRSPRQARRPRAGLHRAQLPHRTVTAWRHERRRQSVQHAASRRAPQLRRGPQLQPRRVTIRRAGPTHPGQHARQGIKRPAARSPRRSMLHAGPPRLAQVWLQQRAMA